MTYNVFGGTLNLAQSVNQTLPSVVNEWNSTEFCHRFGSEPDYTAAVLLVISLSDFSFLSC